MIESAKEVKEQATTWERKTLELEAELKAAQEQIRVLEERKRGGVGLMGKGGVPHTMPTLAPLPPIHAVHRGWPIGWHTDAFGASL